MPGGCIDTRLVIAFPAGRAAGWLVITTPVGKSGSVDGLVRCCARVATKGPLPTARPPARGMGFYPLQLLRLFKSAPESRHPATFNIAVSMSVNEVAHFQSSRRKLANCRSSQMAAHWLPNSFANLLHQQSISARVDQVGQLITATLDHPDGKNQRTKILSIDRLLNSKEISSNFLRSACSLQGCDKTVSGDLGCPRLGYIGEPNRIAPSILGFVHRRISQLKDVLLAYFMVKENSHPNTGGAMVLDLTN